MLLTLPPELQLLFVELLVAADLVAAGRLAQASVACKQLLQHPLAALLEKRRLAQQARMEAQRQRQRAAMLEFFTPSLCGLFLQCNAHAMAGGTPCGRAIRAARDAYSPRSASSMHQALIAHLQNFHSAEYGAFMLSLQDM